MSTMLWAICLVQPKKSISGWLCVVRHLHSTVRCTQAQWLAALRGQHRTWQNSCAVKLLTGLLRVAHCEKLGRR